MFFGARAAAICLLASSLTRPASAALPAGHLVAAVPAQAYTTSAEPGAVVAAPTAR